MSSRSSSAAVESLSPPSTATAVTSSLPSSLRPRSPTLAASADDGSQADSRRVRARVDDADQVLDSAGVDSVVPSCASVLAALSSYSKHELRTMAEALMPRLSEDRAAHPTRSAPIISLPEELVLLIMQCCDRVSLLALARCNRATLAAASNDFAWRCLSPIRVRSTLPELAHRLSSSLLRYVDVCLLMVNVPFGSPFVAPAGADISSINDAERASLTTVQRLRGLDCSLRLLPPEKVQLLLSVTACAQLTLLRLMNTMTPELLRLIPQRLPLLRSLSINVSTAESAEGLASLAQLQHLTELRVESCNSQADVSALSACRSLRTLSLKGNTYDSWPTLLAAPSMQSLRSLELHCATSSDPRSVSDWDAAFGDQRALDSLLIANCLCTDLWLPLLARHCRSLRTLTVRFEEVVDPADLDAHDGRDQPTVSALRECLQQLPSMRLQLEMPTRSAWMRDCGDESSAVERWDPAHASFTQLALDFADRVNISLQDE